LAQELRIITLAHSQGNFYSLFAYDLLNDSQKKHMDIVSVATPASRSLNDQYTTFKTDRVITSIPTALPPNLEKEMPGPFDHRFTEDYLEDHNSKTQILSDLNSAAQKTVSDRLNGWVVTDRYLFDRSLHKTVLWVRDYFERPRALKQFECLIVFELMYISEGFSNDCSKRNLQEVELALDHCALDLAGSQPHGKTACPFFGPWVEFGVDAEEFMDMNPNCQWRSRADFLNSGLKPNDLTEAKEFIRKISR
jgi:hypothetical protein